MSVSNRYSILFELKILHHYFLNRGNQIYDQMNDNQKVRVLTKYNTSDFMGIVPTQNCSRILNDYRCIFKNTPTGFLVGIKSGSETSEPDKFKPFLALPDNLVFDFLVLLKDQDFLNYTALPLKGNESQVYVFHNDQGISQRKFPAVNASPPAYAAGTKYFPGDMLSDNPDNPTELFIANVKTENDTSSDDWLVEEGSENFPVSYAGIKDRFMAVNKIINYSVKEAGIEPGVTIKDSSDVEIKPVITILPGEYRTVQSDLGNYPVGFYNMSIDTGNPSTSETITFYLLKKQQVPFGVIRISVKNSGAGDDFNLLDTGGYLSGPSFELRFRNRATHWRYLGKGFNENSFTESPLPLTRHGLIDNVSVPGSDGELALDLPNPSVSMIKAEALISDLEDKYYSEIHFNKL